jgi:hypothetical protein
MMRSDQSNEFGIFRIEDDSVYLRLHRTLDLDVVTVRSQKATIFLEARRDSKVVGEGSGFVVLVPNSKEGFFDDFVVVTARHNVSGTERRGGTVSVMVPGTQQHEAVTIAIPPSEWFHGAHDASVALLPISELGVGTDLLPIPMADFSFRLPIVTPLHANLYGRGRVGNGAPLFVRTAWVQTAERPRVAIDGVEEPVHVLIAEGTVTPGMSGGPVAATTGAFTSGSGLLGLTHGYAYGQRVDEPVYEIQSEELRHVRTELMREIHALRQQMIYIVPSEAIVPVIATCLRSYYPERRNLTIL